MPCSTIADAFRLMARSIAADAWDESGPSAVAGAGLGAGAGEYARGFGIGAERRLAVAFRAIHCRVGRGVDHDIRRNALDQCGQRPRLVEVADLACNGSGQLSIARGAHDVARLCQATVQLAADLTVGAQQQDLHAA